MQPIFVVYVDKCGIKLCFFYVRIKFCHNGEGAEVHSVRFHDQSFQFNIQIKYSHKAIDNRLILC